MYHLHLFSSVVLNAPDIVHNITLERILEGFYSYLKEKMDLLMTGK